MGKIPNSFSNVAVNTPDFAIDYKLPSKVDIMPNSFLWPIAVARDRFQLMTANSLSQKAQIMLALADNRLVAAKKLADEGNYTASIMVLGKAEDYLMHSYKTAKLVAVGKSKPLVHKISLASLKHREVLEEIYAQSPDEGRPMVVKQIDTTKLIYDQSKIALEVYGENPPLNPFEDRI